MPRAPRLLAALVLCASLTGCSDDPSGLVRVDGVGAATQSAGVALEPLPSDGDLAWVVRAARRALATSAEVAGTVELTGHGTRVDLGPLPQAMRFTGRFDLRRGVGSLSVGLAGSDTGTIQEVFLPGTVYVSNLPQVRLGFWGAIARPAVRTHYLYRAPANDPRVLVALVADAEEMARTGPDLIGTTPAIRFRGYVTSEVLVAHAGTADAVQLRQLLIELGPQARRLEVWTTLDGRLLQLRLGFVARQGGQEVSVSTQLDLSRFGVKVAVKAPPKARTTPVTALRGFLFG